MRVLDSRSCACPLVRRRAAKAAQRAQPRTLQFSVVPPSIDTRPTPMRAAACWTLSPAAQRSSLGWAAPMSKTRPACTMSPANWLRLAEAGRGCGGRPQAALALAGRAAGRVGRSRWAAAVYMGYTCIHGGRHLVAPVELLHRGLRRRRAQEADEEG